MFCAAACAVSIKNWNSIQIETIVTFCQVQNHTHAVKWSINYENKGAMWGITFNLLIWIFFCWFSENFVEFCAEPEWAGYKIQFTQAAEVSVCCFFKKVISGEQWLCFFSGLSVVEDVAYVSWSDFFQLWNTVISTSLNEPPSAGLVYIQAHTQTPCLPAAVDADFLYCSVALLCLCHFDFRWEVPLCIPFFSEHFV